MKMQNKELIEILINFIIISLFAVDVLLFFVIGKAVFDGRIWNGFLYSLLFTACIASTVGLAEISESL